MGSLIAIFVVVSAASHLLARAISAACCGVTSRDLYQVSLIMTTDRPSSIHGTVAFARGRSTPATGAASKDSRGALGGAPETPLQRGGLVNASRAGSGLPYYRRYCH